MRNMLVAVLLALVLPMAAEAKSFKIGDDAPFATVSVPDSWGPEEIDNGVSGNSDAGTYVQVEAVALKDIEGTITENLKYLAGEGVSINDSSLKKGEAKINGVDLIISEWHGTDKDGEAVVTIAVAVLDAERTVVMTTWSSPDAEKADGKEIEGIAGSIKAVAK